MPPDPSSAAAMKTPRVKMPPEPDTLIAAATFPLVFSDGERETPAGSLVVFSNTDLAKFKALVAKKLRGEPHRVAAFLVRRKRGKSSPGRKTPIDDSTDFAALVRQRDCHVLALLRKSPPRRPRRPPKGGGGWGGGFVMPEPPAAWDRQLQLQMQQLHIQDRELQVREHELKREQLTHGGGFVMPDPAAAWERQLQLQLQQLQIEDQELQVMEHELEREQLTRYPCLVGEARQRYTEAVGDVRRRGAAAPVCGVCNTARGHGWRPEFHFCVHDQMVDNFRTVAGPIRRPSAMMFD